MGTAQQYDSKHFCPHCGAAFDATTGLDDAEDLGPGDMSVCAYCLRPAMFVRFAGRLALRPMTDAETAAAWTDPKLAPVMARIRALQRG